MRFYTYLLFDPRDNKPFYVGKGCNRRMTFHERQVKLNKVPNNNIYLFNKIKKILDLGLKIKYKQSVKNVNESTSFKWETKFISCLRSKGYDLCNVSDGGVSTKGNLGKRYTPEEKEQLSIRRKGMFTLGWFIEKYGDRGGDMYNERSKLLSDTLKGRSLPPITEKTRQKMVDSHLGKKQSPETILKRSKAMMGKGLGRVVSDDIRKRMSLNRKGKPSNMLGKTHTLESRMKMKQSHVKSYTFVSPSNETVSITCLKDFCKEVSINYGNMSSVATGRRKSCQGWRLLTPNE